MGSFPTASLFKKKKKKLPINVSKNNVCRHKLQNSNITRQKIKHLLKSYLRSQQLTDVLCYLFVKGVNHMYPVVLFGVIAEYGLGQTTAHIDQVVEGHCCDATLRNGDVGPK